MALKELVFDVPATVADAIADTLLEDGALSVSLEDADAGTSDECPSFHEAGESAEPGWRRVRLLAQLNADCDPGALLSRASEIAGCSPSALRAETRAIPDEDWVRKSRRQFQPIRIDAGLWVVPSWCEPVEPDALNLRLDPGIAFGTGSHPTTALCLRWLHERVRVGVSMLDFGCGSGILAIAAAMMGASTVWATDIDEAALAHTALNAARNRAQVRVVSSLDDADPSFDLVVANILANPLRVLAPALARRVRPAGRLALSGLLDSQADELIETYTQYFDMRRFAVHDGWACLEGARR